MYFLFFCLEIMAIYYRPSESRNTMHDGMVYPIELSHIRGSRYLRRVGNVQNGIYAPLCAVASIAFIPMRMP